MGPLGQAFGRAVVFEPEAVEGRKPVPTMIEPFYKAAANAQRAAERRGQDVLGLEAVREYYRWLYWEQGYEALDAATIAGVRFPILPAIRETAATLDFPFARIAEAFHIIDDVMDPIIVPWDDEAKAATDSLTHADVPPAGVQRRLQHYVVGVPSKVREAMLKVGAVQAIRADLYGDRFIVLTNMSLYDEAVGLRLDDPTWRSSESNVF